MAAASSGAWPRKPAMRRPTGPPVTRSIASQSVRGAIADRCRRDELGQHASQPERDQRAEDGISHDAGDELRALEHRLHEHRAADPRRGGPHRLVAPQVEQTPPVSVLCAPAAADLTTTAPPIAEAAAAAAPGVRATTSGASGMP